MTAGHEPPPLFTFPEGNFRGHKVKMLIRAGRTTAEQVAHTLSIRGQILRDIAPAVSRGKLNESDLPQIRAKNLEWAADELDIAGETITALSATVPRTLRDFVNEHLVDELAAALRMIRDEAGGTIEIGEGEVKDQSWCSGVAMSALARLDELLEARGETQAVVATHTVGPDDVVTLHVFDKRLTSAAAKVLSESVKAAFPGRTVAVIVGDMHVGVERSAA